MTLKAEGNPQDAQNNVIVKSLSEIQYTFSNKQNWWSQYIVNINNITSDLDLSIYSGGDGAEDYEYDKDYAVHKQQVDEATLDSSNNWSHTWNNLLSKDGNDDCYYTIEEEVPSGYQVSYTNNEGIQKGDIIVTNKKLDNNYDLPDSGGFGTTGYYAIGALLITATLFAYIANKRKKGVQ